MTKLQHGIAIGVLAILAACTPAERPAETPQAPAESAAPVATASPAAAESAAPVASLKDFDVVLVVVDGLRADRAADATVAPFMGELASHGVNFTNAAASSSHVLQSLASLFTGMLPTNGGTIGVYEAEPHDETTTLAEYFQQKGYYTGLLANHPAIQGKGFTQGFEEVQIAQAGQTLDDALLVKRAAEFLKDAADDRIFLYVHFAGPLASKLYHGGDAGAGPLSVREYGANPTQPADAARATATVAEYDAAVHAADAQVHALVDTLKAAGRNNTLLVVTSLHGFELFEHGYLGAGWTLYDESIRVPLILSAPGALPAQASDAQVGLVDVLPTTLALLELGAGAANLDGAAALVPGVAGVQIDPARPRIAELVIPERCILRTVSQGEWSYLASSLWAEPKDRLAVAEAHRATANAYVSGERAVPPLWGAEAREAVFKNGAEVSLPDNEQARASLSMTLDEYRQRCEQTGIAPRGATKSVSAVDPEKVQNLESLGYL